MTAFTPGYGETPVSDDEMQALLADARTALGSPINKAAIFDLEQELQNEVTEQLLTQVLVGELALQDLLHDGFVRELHGRLYGETWTWARRFRKRELNIGVAPEQIAVDLRNAWTASSTAGTPPKTGRRENSASPSTPSW
ncbi:hypothetical protein L6E12_00210 [Actinokineospora sp. PR83]|uniref:hypothetical protein n=1 Tax=Actinokineospora sp. PR83 TaxID=2884908 RepID=UPI001F3EF885|nr:hypothetical protein [Actinokineospora sp. PR83]MCG8914221.1 hypothetical protein [Actinokineospora sp. PR83]